MTFGTFVQPDVAREQVDDPVNFLGLEIYSGYRASTVSDHLLGHNSIFDALQSHAAKADFPYEDQCSAQYYFDLVRTLRDLNGEYNRVVEVGVFMGGSSSILAGCTQHFDFDLDLVDISLPFLQVSYERIRRLYPQHTGRIRLFHGDLPSYVRHELDSPPGKYIVHHDGAHDFNQVVKDMSSLYFIRERICAIIAQDTHLRGAVSAMNFVDMAMYAVFGLDLQYASIGTIYSEHDSRTAPNIYQGNYFFPGAAEGFVVPMKMNTFKYPHPHMSMDELLPPPVTLKVQSTI